MFQVIRRPLYAIIAVLLSAFPAWPQTWYFNGNDVLTNDRDFNRAYHWTSNQNGTGTHPVSDRDDDFTSNTLGSKWFTHDADNDGSTGAYDLTTNADQLTITARGADMAGATNQFYSVYRKDMRGNWEATVKVVSQTNTDGWAKAGIIVADSITDLAKGGYAFLAMTPSNGVEFKYDITGNVGELENLATVANSTYPVWLRMVKKGLTLQAYMRTSTSNTWTLVGSSQTPQSGNLFSQTGLFVNSHNTGSTGTAVFDDWQGGGRISGTGLTLSLDGGNCCADANMTVSSDLNVASLDGTNYWGALSMGGDHGLFATYYDNDDLTGTTYSRVDTTIGLDFGGGSPDGTIGSETFSATFEGWITPEFTETYTFYMNADDGIRFWLNDSLMYNNWPNCLCGEQNMGTYALTAGVRYPVVIHFRENTGGAALQFRYSSTSTPKQLVPKSRLWAGHINATGNVTLHHGTVVPQDGLIEFSGSSGTQVFKPEPGGSGNMPMILHSGASTLQLTTNALVCQGFFQSAGTFDFNGVNLTTVNAGTGHGDLSVWNGTSTSFTNMGGRTVTVAGSASFTGTSTTNSINLNPGSGWTLAVTGKLDATYATVTNSNASSAAGIAYKSGSGGGNTAWTLYGQTFNWNGNPLLGNSTDASKAYNYGYNGDGLGWHPQSSTDDLFAGNTLGSAWTAYDRDGTDYGNITIGGGLARISARGGDIWGGTNEYQMIYRSDITGDFDVSVKLQSVENNTGSWKAGIMLADDFTNLPAGGYAKLNLSGGGNIEFSRDEGGNVGEIDANTDVSAQAVPLWLRLVKYNGQVSAFYKTSALGAWTQISTAKTLLSMATDSKIGLFMCGRGNTVGMAFDEFQGGTAIASTDEELGFNSSGANQDVNATLSSSFSAGSVDLTGYSGTFGFGTYTLSLTTGNFTASATSGISAGSGTLAFTNTNGATTQYLTPRAGQTFPAISKSGAATLTWQTNALRAGAVTVTGGALALGGGTLNDTVASIAVSGSASLNFGSNTLNVNTGNADLSGVGTLTAGSGTLYFTAATGTQTFTPKSGGGHPHINHSGAAILQLTSNNLSALSYTQTAGGLDFNGCNITTTSSGNFSLTNGTTTTISNLGGRTLTIAGTTTLNGQSGNLLNVNPASGWTVASTGALTGNYVNLANSAATVSTGVATNYTNGGGNTNWGLPGATDYSGWQYSAQININTGSTGANISSAVANFPLLVRLDSTNFIFSQTYADGRDIRFMDPDGTGLNYEIERYDPTIKRGEIWVLVPQVEAGHDRDFITMYWGKAGVSSTSSPTGVFATSNSFAGVWHLNAAYGDATANANNGANTSSTDSAGVIARARNFQSGQNQYVEIPYSATLNLPSFTFSAWTKLNNWTTDMGIMSTRFGGEYTFDAQWHSGVGLHGDVGNGSGWLTTVANHTYTASTGIWYYVTWTATVNAWKVYLNGALAASGSYGGTPQLMKSGETMRIGQTMNNGYFAGIIDEPRVDAAVRSADWIKLCYETQKPGSSVLNMASASLANWAYNTKVYVNTTAGGANITTDQANYPLLVRLSNANFNFSQARSDGWDLRFADSSGALMAYEVERWDAANKVAEIWVLVPSVKGNNNSQWFRMYWGRPTATTLSSGSSVFLSPGNYVGVWHLAEDGSTTAGAYKDATGYAHNGQGVNTTNASDVAAIVGVGGNFSSGSVQSITVPASAQLHPSTGLTIQAWINSTSQAAYKRIAGRPFTSAGTPWNEFDLELNDNGTKVSFSLTVGGTEAGYATTSTISNGSWYLVAGTYDNVNQKIYFNGNLEGYSARTGAISDYAQNFAIGRYGHGNSDWDGKIDEVRVATVAKSADWMKLDYESMKAGSTVVTVGNRSLDYAKSVQLNFNTTVTGANVTGTDVTNVPILVRLNSTNFDFSSTRDDGRDIQFVDRDGAFLYHEVVGNWDKGNKTATVWVKVPQVDRNSTSDFVTLYYGCAACTANPYAKSDSVWNGYISVYHLPGSEAQAADAGPLANHGLFQGDLANAAGVTSPNSAYFDGGAGSYIDVGGEANYDLTTNLSVSAWVKVYAWGNTWAAIVNKGDQNFRLHRRSNTDQAAFAVNTGGGARDAYGANINDGAWHHVVGTYDGATVKVYVDGTVGGTAPAATGNIDNDNNNVSIGRNTTVAGRLWQGGIGEVRISNANANVLSADFIKLSYENQKANSTFMGTSVQASATSFQKTKVFKLNTTASGANITDDVYDFPLLLRIAGSVGGTPITDLAQSTGADIRFLDGDGVTWLPYQIERWSQAVDSAEVWVKVPRIRGNNASGTITMYYQQASGVTVPDGQCGTCVFGSANGYLAAWHLGEDGNNTAGGYRDATSNAYNLTGNNMTNSSDVGAVVGYGQTFNGSSTYLDAGNVLSMERTNSYTLYAWGWHSAASDGAIISKLGTSAPQTGWDMAHTWDGYAVGHLISSWNGSAIREYSTGTYGTGAWTQFAITYDGSSAAPGFRIFANGTEVGTTIDVNNLTSSTANVGGASMHIGVRAGGGGSGMWYNGIIDEVQVSGVARSASWIKLAYQNQRRDAAPLFNPSTADFQKSKKFVFNTTKTGADVTGNVTDFPMLVRINGSVGGTPITDLVQGTGTNAPPDIRFLDGDGKTWLNYQVERWDRGASVDSGEVWVLVPQVDGNSDHDFITMYYQQASGVSVADGQCATCVFSTSNGFAGVWHLQEDGNNNVGGYSDATSNANHGQGVSMTASSDIAGIAGYGQDMDGSADYISVPDAASLDPSVLSLTAWIRPSSSWSTTGQIVDKGGNQGPRYRVLSDKRIQVLDRGNTNTLYSTVPDTVPLAQWSHAAVTMGTGGLSLYLNGVLKASNSTPYGAPSTAFNLLFAKYEGGGAEMFKGTLDEIALANVVRSADWMKLSYETQRPSGNAFWNSRPGPNNLVSLTATAGTSSITLSWNTPISDSGAADSVALWVKYSAFPDSANVAGATKVVRLPKTDSAYAYPATYPGTYWFSLAVKDSTGKWSPITAASSDTANLTYNVAYPDTIYVDSAIGSDANNCTAALNPATPKLKFSSALTCGANATDTLVIRYMPGRYTDSIFDDYADARAVVVTSFDNKSRAVFNGSGSGSHDGSTRYWTAFIYGNSGLRNVDIKCAVNNNSGVYIKQNYAFVEGCRIYNDGNLKHDKGIEIQNNSDQHHFSNNLIYQPTTYGIYNASDNSYNLVNNTLVGTGSAGTKAIYVPTTAFAADANITNNILWNWDYGIQTASAAIGTCANNIFHSVTTANMITTTTCTGSITKDPLFSSTTPNDPNAFKLLPGSSAIDAGTTTYTTGGQSVTRRSLYDLFGTARYLGTAPDIGAYEGTGYVPNPMGEFDTLSTSSTASTLTVETSKWKVVFDKARGSGITEFYDKVTAPGTNLVASNSLLFDVKLGTSWYVSGQTVNGIAPAFTERSRTRAVVQQRVAYSATLDLTILYSFYGSGHVYVTAEFNNMGSTAFTMPTVDFIAKLGTTSGAYSSGGSVPNGFGYLTTGGRDLSLSVTRDLSEGASAAETWTGTAASGSPGTVTFASTTVASVQKGMRRRGHFLMYLGESTLNQAKAAQIAADAYVPSVVSASAGSLLLERTWQDGLSGHWNFDDGGGSNVRDRAVNTQNNATLSGANYKWNTGKVNGAITLTATDVATVADNALFEAQSAMTVMFWVKPDFAGGGDNAFILSKGLTTSDGWYAQKYPGANKIRVNVGAANVTSNTLTDGVWTHVAFVVKPGTSPAVWLYVNGALDGVSASGATTVANASALLIGNNTGAAADKFKGDIDDVRIFTGEIAGGDIQAVAARGFSSQYGHYSLRADNNNRVVALLNPSTAASRVQPSFQITNWYGGRTPKYVYLNGSRLIPNVDYAVDSTLIYLFGSYLVLQLNKTLTGADQVLFVDDDDSTGFMGSGTAMKGLTITATANDKIAIRNFADTVFGGVASKQWYLELDLNGWATPTASPATNGFGDFNVWKAAAINPNLAISGGTNQVGVYDLHGRTMTVFQMDKTGSTYFNGGGYGYAGPSNITYTLTDSSATRLSLTLSAMTFTGNGNVTLTKRWTVYPTGRIFGSYQITANSFNWASTSMWFQGRYNGGLPTTTWSQATATANARYGLMGGGPDFHSLIGGILSIKSAGSTVTAPGSLVSGSLPFTGNNANNDYNEAGLYLQTGLFQTGDVPITLNFAMDISRDFTDSATADSLMKDIQTPAVITAITGTRTTSDALDFNGDNFAEGDGAYTYAASSGIAHFRFVNSVPCFNPAFRISTWTQGTLPEAVIMDNQVLVKGYHYNAYLNTASDEVILQFNKTLVPGTHSFFISHKSGLAVSLRTFDAVGGEGVDTLKWTTESEFENLGYHLYRRVAPGSEQVDTALAETPLAAGAGIANALASAARSEVAKRAAAKLAKAGGDSGSAADTLPSMSLSTYELRALGYERITARLIPGAPNGSSASTRDYAYIDRTAAFGVAYEYLLEAVDFNGAKAQYGPRLARPGTPLATELHSNYPNPFNPVTTLRFSLKEKLKVSLIIYDSKGRLVRTLVRDDKPMLPGKYRLTWDARNENGLEAPSGQYFYRFTAGRYVKTRKMILVK